MFRWIFIAKMTVIWMIIVKVKSCRSFESNTVGLVQCWFNLNALAMNQWLFGAKRTWPIVCHDVRWSVSVFYSLYITHKLKYHLLWLIAAQFNETVLVWFVFCVCALAFALVPYTFCMKIHAGPEHINSMTIESSNGTSRHILYVDIIQLFLNDSIILHLHGCDLKEIYLKFMTTAIRNVGYQMKKTKQHKTKSKLTNNK